MKAIKLLKEYLAECESKIERCENSRFHKHEAKKWIKKCEQIHDAIVELKPIK